MQKGKESRSGEARKCEAEGRRKAQASVPGRPGRFSPQGSLEPWEGVQTSFNVSLETKVALASLPNGHYK